jgi:hypothetical protein
MDKILIAEINRINSVMGINEITYRELQALGNDGRVISTQFKNLKNSKKPKVLHIPGIEIFGNSWKTLQSYLNRRGDPPYSFGDNLDLRNIQIESL